MRKFLRYAAGVLLRCASLFQILFLPAQIQAVDVLAVAVLVGELVRIDGVEDVIIGAHTPTVEPGSFGFQFYAVSLVVANTVLVLFGRQEDRVAWLSLALMLNSLLVLLVTEWLRRRRH